MLPPVTVLLDVGKKQIVHPINFRDYQISLRTAIPRAALNSMKCVFNIVFENDGD